MLSPANEDVQEIVRENPPILPLSWLSLRISESGVKSGWEKEFETKTGLSSTQPYASPLIATQVFKERTAQRIYENAI